MYRSIRYVVCAVLVVLAFTVTPPPAQATTTSIGDFYADCGFFSVDVAVTGNQDNGGGMDRFRFRVTDGNNNTLYQEDASIKVGTTTGSQVANLGFSMGATKNPIRFTVVELDNNSNATGDIGSVTFNAPCHPANGTANRTGFRFTRQVHGTIHTTSTLYMTPGGGPLNLTVAAGKVHNVIYRTQDNAWVAIFVGSPNLVWIPASVINVDLNQLAFRPTRVFGSSLAPAANPAAPGGTGGVTVRAQLNLRAGAGTNFVVLTKIPRNSSVMVLGANARRTWLKVTYNGQTGWVARTYVNMTLAAVRALPVVE